MKLISTLRGHDPKVIYDLRTARKRYQCEDYPESSADVIKPGEQYVLVTEMPGGESGYATEAGHPVRMRLCANCAGVGTRLVPVVEAVLTSEQ